MSSNKRSPLTTKHSLRLRAGDMAVIQAAHPTIGANAAIRARIATWVDQLRAGAKPADIAVSIEEPADAQP